MGVSVGTREALIVDARANVSVISVVSLPELCSTAAGEFEGVTAGVIVNPGVDCSAAVGGT
jgi:hypothetical protein